MSAPVTPGVGVARPPANPGAPYLPASPTGKPPVATPEPAPLAMARAPSSPERGASGIFGGVGSLARGPGMGVPGTSCVPGSALPDVLPALTPPTPPSDSGERARRDAVSAPGSTLPPGAWLPSGSVGMPIAVSPACRSGVGGAPAPGAPNMPGDPSSGLCCSDIVQSLLRPYTILVTCGRSQLPGRSCRRPHYHEREMIAVRI